MKMNGKWREVMRAVYAAPRSLPAILAGYRTDRLDVVIERSNHASGVLPAPMRSSLGWEHNRGTRADVNNTTSVLTNHRF